jgi:hypothetical protein
MYHPYIREKLAEARSREFERKAREHTAVERDEPQPAEIRIRYAAPADEPRLRSLEQRAGAPHLPAPVVVVDINGALLAAKSLRDGATVADPTHRGRCFEEVVALSVAGLVRG